MDQQANAGYEKQPDAGERIEQEAGVGVERSLRTVVGGVGQVAGVAAEPRIENRLIRLVEIFWRRRPR